MKSLGNKDHLTKEIPRLKAKTKVQTLIVRRSEIDK